MTATAKKQKIALLLPSKGPHAEAAKTIRDGFLSNYYSDLEKKSADPSVKAYDTLDGTMVEAAFRQAIADGVDMIVGPLTKPEVEIVSKMSSPVPILALNSIGIDKGSNRFYQFGLIPEDEVVAVAEHAKYQGHQRALIITIKNDWSQRIARAYSNVWHQMGGEIVGTLAIEPHMQHDALSDLIESTIQNRLQTTSYSKKPRITSSHKSIDMIFLALHSPEWGRQLKPLISFHSHNSMPVYATSGIYSGTPRSNIDQDLDGIRFCDMPWILNNINESQISPQKTQTLWPANNKNSPRYFALGLDAYRLAQLLSNNNTLPYLGIPGATGTLKIEGHRIHRELTCAKFEHGIPVPD